jgi:hypothetical protein
MYMYIYTLSTSSQQLYGVDSIMTYLIDEETEA